jgi:hypothetical protein
MMRLEACRSDGRTDATCSGTAPVRHRADRVDDRHAGEADGGGRDGERSDSRPPRRAGMVTAIRPLAAMCLAFQLSQATATYSRRPSVAYTTPLDWASAAWGPSAAMTGTLAAQAPAFRPGQLPSVRCCPGTA